MSKEIVTVGDYNLADETVYCPNCGVQIDYYNIPPNYCPKCGSSISITNN